MEASTNRMEAGGSGTDVVCNVCHPTLQRGLSTASSTSSSAPLYVHSVVRSGVCAISSE